ncbi:hypothetical protein LCGC14_2178190 [marine sediment metagenome]|uniref:Uncharacterized protein n=1 Tax=marine sediment metagenome TaxID=412755 RepID=A0A0F9G0L6_9ZZZZ
MGKTTKNFKMNIFLGKFYPFVLRIFYILEKKSNNLMLN